MATGPGDGLSVPSSEEFDLFSEKTWLDPHGSRRRIADLFTPEATIAAMLEVEVALAKAQAELGVIPTEAAREIERSAACRPVTPDAVRTHAATVGHPMVAVLDAWCERLDPLAAQSLHFGTTTSDIFRTVRIRQLHQVVVVLVDQMRAIEQRLARLAHKHRATPMIGRTLGRHGLPITFGMKLAGWLFEHRRCIERLQAWRDRFATGALSGAVGTYSITGDFGPVIEARVMELLGLGVPDPVDQKGAMDGFAEFGAALAIAARCHGRMAQEIFLLQGDDIRELAVATSAVGSSTMPHKTNPTLAIEVMSRSREVAGVLPILLEWMLTIHERDSAQHGGALEQMCIDMGQVVSCMGALLDVLVVLPENMRRNMDRTGGAVLTEALTAALAPSIGRRAAHDILNSACRRMAETGRDLVELLREHPDTHAVVLPTMEECVGQAPQIVDRTLAALDLDGNKGSSD